MRFLCILYLVLSSSNLLVAVSIANTILYRKFLPVLVRISRGEINSTLNHPAGDSIFEYILCKLKKAEAEQEEIDEELKFIYVLRK